MAGLLNPQPQEEQQGMPQQQAGQEAPAVAEEETNVSPEEQAQYDEFVTNGMQLIYNKDSLPQMMESLAGDGNPIEGLANALVAVVARLEDSAADNGTELSGDVMYHGAVELMEQVVELAEAAGIHDFSQEEMDTALYMALDIYRQKKQQDGTLPVADLQEDMSELEAADRAGRIDDLLPGLSEYAAQAPSPEDAEQAMQGRRE